MLSRSGFVALTLGSVGALSSCSASGGGVNSAESVDIPLTVSVSVSDYHVPHGYFSIDASVTNEGKRNVWVLECRGVALNSSKEQSFEFTFGLGLPAGLYVAAGKTASGGAVVKIPATPHRLTNARSFAATCEAIDWHGNPPI
jgi:hypothetical protein